MKRERKELQTFEKKSKEINGFVVILLKGERACQTETSFKSDLICGFSPSIPASLLFLCTQLLLAKLCARFKVLVNLCVVRAFVSEQWL